MVSKLNGLELSASNKTKDIGRQFENAKPMHKAKNITFGDIHDTNGEVIYYKEK